MPSPSRPAASSSTSPSRRATITRIDEPHSKLDPEARGSIMVKRWRYRPQRYSMRMIAAGAGLSVSEVCRVLNGQRTGRVQTLAKIAAHLGLTLDVLNTYLTTQRPKHKR